MPNLMKAATWYSKQGHLAPSLPFQERAKRPGSPSELCTVAMNISFKPATGILLPPIAQQNCIGGEAVDFPRSALCCTGDAWTSIKPAPSRNGRVQSCHVNTTNESAYLQVLQNIINFFAYVCGTAISFLFHF